MKNFFKNFNPKNNYSLFKTQVRNITIKGDPYDWPFDGNLKISNTALIIIDMQKDFLSKGGYVDHMGYDLALTNKCVPKIKSLLEVCREKGIKIIHTREGHLPNLSDLPNNKRWRSKRIGAEIGSKGPLGRILTRGEEGWDIIDELYPRENEVIIEKPGKGSFHATELEFILKISKIENILLTGITTDVCVSTTMREGNDKGFEILLIEDCCGATKLENHYAAIDMVKMQGGVFGSVSSSDKVIPIIQKLQD
eukprot:TRINITY_DN10302_c0_g1_i1.p1 TRINITY_DN10302_c0_g1~~TRINITY_DN10302_c0_g1_i1.p1  ORF type:complete len:252 (-),score=83.88 TRINITY_DN10302_c0_g1_i1:46-801(-)